MDPKTTPPTDQMTNQDNAGFMTPPPTAPQSDQQQQDTTDQPGPASLSVADLAEGNIAPDDNHTVIADNTQSSSEHGRPKAKILATILGIALLVLGVGAGVVLVRQPAQFRTSAWDCDKYNFEVNQDGVVTVKNESNRNEPLQLAKIYINSVEVATLDVPNLNAGDSATLGNVSVPDDGFSWQVIGSKDCSDSGNYGPKETPAPPELETKVDCSGGYIKNTSNQNVSGIFEQFDPYFKKEFSLTPGESTTQEWQGDLTPDITLMYVDVTGTGRIAGEHYPPNCSTPTATPTGTPTSTPTPTPTPTPTSTPPNACIEVGCSQVQAYLVTGSVTVATNWTALTNDNLENLESGDKIYFTVLGTTSQGLVDKARFRVNSIDWDGEVTDKRPGSEEFYYIYEVPSGVYSFEIYAQVHHNELDIWM